MKHYYGLALTALLLLLNPLSASAMDTCVEITAPVTSVADFDANGVVNRKDIRIITRYIRHMRLHKRLASLQNRGSKRVNSKYFRKHLDHQVAYSPLLDRNADGKINHRDVMLTARDMKKESTEEDQKLATINNEILDGTYTCVAEQEEPAAAPIITPTTQTKPLI